MKHVIDEAETKSTPEFLNVKAFAPGKVHPIWINSNYNSNSILKANVQVEMACGTYILQSTRARFNQYQVSRVCPLCKASDETVLTVYIYIRTKYIFYKWGSPSHMHNLGFNMVYPAFRCGHGKLCHMNFFTSTTVLLKEEEFIDQNRTYQMDFDQIICIIKALKALEAWAS